MKNDFILTKHAKERFIERSNKKYKHLSRCGGCQTCYDLTYELKNALNDADIEQEIFNCLNAATEVKSYLNNTDFMLKQYEKYGFERRFQFLVYNDILFVAVFSGSKRTIVTCLKSQQCFNNFVVKQKKFKKSIK